MRMTLALAATAMMALAAPALAQQAGQPGSPGIGPGGQPPGMVRTDRYGNVINGDGMSEGRASAPYDAAPEYATPPRRDMRNDPMAPNYPASRNNGQ